MPEEGGSAGTIERGVLVDAAALEAGQRDDGLERRAGRPLRLNGAVQQRVAGIFGQFFPVGGLDVHREFVGVETGWDAIARISPVFGSSATTAPRRP